MRLLIKRKTSMTFPSNLGKAPDPSAHERNVRLLMVNLLFVKALETDTRFVANKKSGKVHLTSGSCLPAVSMGEDRRWYINDLPTGFVFCKFCEKQFLKMREDKIRHGT